MIPQVTREHRPCHDFMMRPFMASALFRADSITGSFFDDKLTSFSDPEPGGFMPDATICNPATGRLSESQVNSDSHELLRIAYFTFSYAPFMTGIAAGAHSRTKALLELGHHVLLIHPLPDGQYSREIQNRPMPGLEEFDGNDRLTEVTYPTRPHRLFPSHPEPQNHRHWSDTKLLDAFRPDVILVDEAAGMYGFSSVMLGGYGRAVGAEYANRSGIPVINLYETDWISYAEHYLGRWLFAAIRPLIAWQSRRFTNKYDSTFFPSEVQRQKNEQTWVRKLRYVSFHGIDCSLFHPDSRRFHSAGDDNRPTMLFVGRMAIEKSTPELFDAVEIVRQRIPDIHLVIIGGGPESDRIARLAAEHPACCTFVGECFGEQLRGWYARANVYVNPSATENFCTTNLESMASGTPIVAAAAGGNREQVIDGENGFLVTPHSPKEMADRVIRILESADLRQRMSIAAREFALKYDFLECGRLLEKSVREMIEEKRKMLLAAPR